MSPASNSGSSALAAELDREVAALGAVERLAVDRARVVDDDGVAGGRGALDRRRLAKPSRSRSSSASIASSGTSTSALPTSSPRHSPSSAVGRTPTSIVNSSSSPSSGRSPTSSFGSPTVASRCPAAPARTTPAARRAAPARPPPRGRCAGSPAAPAPCPCGSRASSSRRRAASPRGRPAWRARRLDRDVDLHARLGQLCDCGFQEGSQLSDTDRGDRDRGPTSASIAC